jgi:hypothetical protein
MPIPVTTTRLRDTASSFLLAFDLADRVALKEKPHADEGSAVFLCQKSTITGVTR